MNTELYFPREGKSFAQTSEKAFEKTVKELSEIDVSILFKTEVNLSRESIQQALKETTTGSEKIDLIFIADALKSSDKKEANEIAASLGIEGKLTPFEASLKKSEETKKEAKKEEEKKSASSGALKLESTEEEKEEENENTAPVQDQAEADEASSVEAETEKTEKKGPESFTAYCTEYNNTLIVLLPTEEATGMDFSTMLFAAASSTINPKQKNSFWKRFIPCSGDSAFDVVRKVILLLAICTFIVSSCMLVNILVLEPTQNDSTNNSIRDLLVSTDEEESGAVVKKTVDGSEGTLVDFTNLLAENSDTIGWVTVPNTLIDYVVVAPPESDPEYYLYRDFYGNGSKYGTVFLDYRSRVDSKNMILHGHHMQDGRMFANLKYYEDIDFYKKTPIFTYNTIYEKAKWEIISIFKTNTLDYQGDFFNYLRGDFQNDYDFLNFIYQVRERSIIDTPVKVNEYDTIVTLSTCAYDFESFRFVVVARKVRDGEKAEVDVSKAAHNPDPLYPDIWYNTYGGTKPEVTSFQDAFNHKKIDWYDGKRDDWSEKDDKELNKTLDEGKEKALEELTKFVEGRTYSDSNKEKVDEILKQYTEMINKATSGSEVNEIYRNALVSIRAVQTISEAEASDLEKSRLESETLLENKKASAKVELHNSIAGNTYRTTQMDAVEKIFKGYNSKIDKAKTVEEVESLKKEGISLLAKIETADEMTKEESERKEEEASKKAKEASDKKAAEEASKAEASKAAAELKEHRNQAVNEIQNYGNLDNYDSAGRAKVNGIRTVYSGKIKSAMSISEIDTLLAEGKQEIDAVPHKKDEPSVEPQYSEEPQSSEPESSTEESSTEPEVPGD